MIKELTLMQAAQISRYTQRGLEIGASTREFSVEEATPIIENLYKVFWDKAKGPSQIIIAENPLEAEKIASQEKQQICSAYDKKFDLISCNLKELTGKDLWKDLQEQIWAVVKKRRFDAVLRAMPFSGSAFFGNLDGNIFALYDYCINVLQIKMEETSLKNYLVWRDTQKLGPLYCFKSVAIISKLPSEFHVNRKGLLHNDSGPAISYNGTLEAFYLSGMELVNRPEILKEVVPLVEDRLRRVDCPIYGETFRRSLL